MTKNRTADDELNVPALIQSWLESRRRAGKISRNTIAVGIVLLDKLREKPSLSQSEVFSPGGEIKGSRSSLGSTLKKYGIPVKFLKEVTTRQAHQDGKALIEGLEYGELLASDSERREQQLSAGIKILVAEAHRWLARQPIRVNCDRQLSPTSWISSILEKARGKSGGKVEQHLVGAKLKQRHPNLDVPNYPGHAGDFQTKRSGDFPLEWVSYHVTATDGKEAIPRCKENVESGVHPVLLVPRRHISRAQVRAEMEGISERVSILAIEDFITQNIIELSTERNEDFFTTLQAIIEEYNRRLEQVETDMSLRIEIM
jgi:hypothetical protein